MKLYEEYIRGVQDGSIIVGRLTRLAVQRHVNDLKKQHDKDYPFYFSTKEADRVITFIKRLKHTGGEWFGKPFNLKPWQAFALACIFGWLKKADNTRRFKKAYIEVARKNGKSELYGAIANYMLLMDGKRGHEVYTAANSRDQAKVVFSIAELMAKNLVKESKKAGKLLGFNHLNVNIKDYKAFMEPLASDSRLLDGRRPLCAVFDEVHEFKDDKLIKVIETGMGSYRDALSLLITTAGFNMYGPCYQFRQICVNILEGIADNPYIWANIYTIDEGDNWQDEKIWQKSNPNLGASPYLSYLQEMFEIAKTVGGREEVEFKTKNLNVWTTTSETYISTEDWVKSGKPFDPENLKGKKCFMGLDLSKNYDITALAAIFPPVYPDTDFKCLFWFWCPQEGIERRSTSDGVPYQRWVKEGLLTATPGKTIDEDFIHDKIIELRNVYDIQDIEYDRRFAYKLVDRLEQAGLPVTSAMQGYNFYTGPIMRLEKLVIDGDLSHNGNEIIQWMNSNVLLKRGSGGGLMIDKEKVTERIDGMSALLMALGGYLTVEPDNKLSVYERRLREGKKDLIKLF